MGLGGIEVVSMRGAVGRVGLGSGGAVISGGSATAFSGVVGAITEGLTGLGLGSIEVPIMGGIGRLNSGVGEETGGGSIEERLDLGDGEGAGMGGIEGTIIGGGEGFGIGLVITERLTGLAWEGGSESVIIIRGRSLDFRAGGGSTSTSISPTGMTGPGVPADGFLTGGLTRFGLASIG